MRLRLEDSSARCSNWTANWGSSDWCGDGSWSCNNWSGGNSANWSRCNNWGCLCDTSKLWGSPAVVDLLGHHLTDSVNFPLYWDGDLDYVLHDFLYNLFYWVGNFYGTHLFHGDPHDLCVWHGDVNWDIDTSFHNTVNWVWDWSVYNLL